MPATIILELQKGTYSPFAKFIAPITQILLENNYRLVSMDPAVQGERTRQVTVSEMVFYNRDRIVTGQQVKELAYEIKATRGRPRFIKSITISYQMQKI